MSLKAFYKSFQDKNPEKFNPEIMNARLKEKETVKDYFDDFFSSMIHDGLTYLGCEVITDESKFEEIIGKEYKDIEFQDTRMDLITSRFRIQATPKEPEEFIDFNLFFPKIIDGTYFYLNGNKYYAVYQLTDRNFYFSNKQGLFLKTLIMPLGLVPHNTSITTHKGHTLYGREWLVNHFKSSASKSKTASKNYFLHLFIKYGVLESIDYIFNDGLEKPIMYMITKEEAYNLDAIEIPEGWDLLPINKTQYLLFKFDPKTAKQAYIDMIITLYSLVSEVKRSVYMMSMDYWKRKMGGGVAGAINKAERGIISLERILDNRTKRNLRECTHSENKNSVYDILRWMAWNFDILKEIDEVDIYNRRLRLFEYLFFPILLKTSKVSYRILNSRSVDNKRLKTLFSNTHPLYIIKSVLTNNLIRYSNNTSNLSTFSSLKWSAKGSQTVGGEKGKVSVKFMDVHPSYLGNVGLNSASASDPGLSGTLCPMNKDFDNLFFEKEGDSSIVGNMYIHSKQQAYFKD